MKNKKDLALKYLQKNYLANIDLIEPIRIDQAEIIYVDDDTVLIKELRSNIYMMVTSDLANANKIIDTISDIQCFRTNQKEQMHYVAQKFNLKETFICKQLVYETKELLPESKRMTFKPLNMDYYSLIKANYDLIADDDIKKHLVDLDLYGGFINDELVGFIGTHLEGSIGLLFVMPNHRKKGYATDLESFMINTQIKQGLVPFAQVKLGNHASFAVQRKLNMTLCDDIIYWAFNT